MGLEIEDAVDDLRPGTLQVARPLDVGFLVEARLELNHRGDRLAGFRGLDQRRDDRRVLRGPVQRLLDRDDARIARRLMEKLHDDVEALIRMVDDDVLGADRREAVAAEIADALGKADSVRREHEVGALVHDQPLRFDQPDQSLADEDVIRRDGQPAAQKLAQVGRHAPVDGQPDHAATAPALQCALEGPHEIFGFLVDLHPAVTQNTEQAIAHQREGLGKQPVDEQQRNLLQQDEAGVRHRVFE